MAEVRKGKADSIRKPRSRAAAGALAAKTPSSVSELRRLLLETQDQLSLIHGVLEELCERQEALSAWQMEFSKRLVNLQQAQWRSLEDLAGVDMGSPVEKAFGIQMELLDSDSSDDHLDEANQMMEQVNSEAMPKRAVRLRKRRHPLRSGATSADEPSSDSDEAKGENVQPDNSPESVFVMPEKVDVH
ncbi:MAG: hypothetical protein RIR26_2499 [Pseudomonadota bacterium]|jgi:hypothetical protein